MQKELTHAHSQVATLSTENVECQRELDSLKQSLQKVQGEFMSTLTHMASVERERQAWEKKAVEAVESERATAELLTRAREDTALSQEATQKLVDGSLELERMLQVADSKNKELASCVSALMKYPDVSLGHEIAMSGEIASFATAYT